MTSTLGKKEKRNDGQARDWNHVSVCSWQIRPSGCSNGISNVALCLNMKDTEPVLEDPCAWLILSAGHRLSLHAAQPKGARVAVLQRLAWYAVECIAVYAVL